MKIALTVGHSILKNGSYTSASGADCGRRGAGHVLEA